jgi:hypothetical protein
MSRRLLSLLALCTALLGPALLAYRGAPGLSADPQAPDDKEARGGKRRANGLTPAPLADWFKPRTRQTINGWIATDDTKAMTEHAWELWAALTSPTEQKLHAEEAPVFMTWWDANEALLAPDQLAKGLPAGTQFRIPVQFQQQEVVRAERIELGLGAPPRPPHSLFEDIKYNDDIKQFIDANRYNDHAELDRINNGWSKSTPVAARNLKAFPDSSVMLKPVYQLVSSSAVTVLPYWAGPANSVTPATPAEYTWRRKMAVVPEGMDPSRVKIRERDADLPVVSVNSFYHIKLTEDEVASVSELANMEAKAGDYMLLVGMHVASREIDSWTWQTFWWSFTRPPVPAGVRLTIAPPFDHYQVSVGYSSMTGGDNPNALPVVCYNPYLETAFGNDTFVREGQLGTESNCVSCHRAAAWPALSPGQKKKNYVANGVVDPGDRMLFANKTKTDYVWGVADGRPEKGP